MSVSKWYYNTYQSINISKQDVIALLQDSNYRPNGWIPQWNEAEFNRANMELSAAKTLTIQDTRLNQHWRDPDWDDVLIDEWWQYVALEYKKYRYEELFE